MTFPGMQICNESLFNKNIRCRFQAFWIVLDFDNVNYLVLLPKIVLAHNVEWIIFKLIVVFYMPSLNSFFQLIFDLPPNIEKFILVYTDIKNKNQ